MIRDTKDFDHYRELFVEGFKKVGMQDAEVEKTLQVLNDTMLTQIINEVIDELPDETYFELMKMLEKKPAPEEVQKLLQISDEEMTDRIIEKLNAYVKNLDSNIEKLQEEMKKNSSTLSA
jgi:phosphohistidine phosphatase SixA